MLPWHSVPLLRLIIPFIGGIALAMRMEALRPLHWSAFCLPASMMILYLLYPSRLITWNSRWITGLLAWCLFGWLGFNAMVYKHLNQVRRSNSLATALEKRGTFILSVTSTWKERPYSWSGTGNIIAAGKAGMSSQMKVPVLLEFPKTCSRLPVYGEMVAARGRLSLLKGPTLPYGFNRKGYYRRKGIYHQLKADDFERGGEKYFTGNMLKSKSIQLRHHMFRLLERNGLKDEELFVGSAILLGESVGNEPELLNAYSAAGVTHILSVSGLHVGLIFICFSKMLFFLQKKRSLVILRIVLLILLTWAYALLTGLSPPVVRSAAMLSLIILARSLSRRVHLLNILAASALMMLVYDPWLLADIGFQLSYLAVAGIVSLQRPLYESIGSKNLILDKTWELSTVTLTAQLATGPLSVMYFHQFPLYFLPANLLIVPLSAIVMYIGITALVMAGIPFAGSLCTKLYSLSLEVMNAIITLVAKLPMAVSGGLGINGQEAWMLYFFLVLLALFIMKRNNIYLILCTLSIFSFSVSRVLPILKPAGNPQLILCHSGGKALTMIKTGKTLFYNGDFTHSHGSPKPHVIINLLINNDIYRIVPFRENKSSMSYKHDTANDATLIFTCSGRAVVNRYGGLVLDPAAAFRKADIVLIDKYLNQVYPKFEHPAGARWLIIGVKQDARIMRALRKYCHQVGIGLYDLRSQGVFVTDIHHCNVCN